MESGKSQCSDQARRMQTHLNCLLSYPLVHFLKFLIFNFLSTCTHMTLLHLFSAELPWNLESSLSAQAFDQKKGVGSLMWRLSKSKCRRRKIPLFSVCKAFLTCFWSLHVDTEQRPVLWSFPLCVCVCVSELLWDILCMYSKQTIMQRF